MFDYEICDTQNFSVLKESNLSFSFVITTAIFKLRQISPPQDLAIN